MEQNAAEDQAKWANLAIHKNLRMRHAAARRLTDEALLAKLALKDRSERVRWAAVRSRFLTDQTVLSTIATEDKAAGVREAAKERLQRLRGQ